MPDYGFIANAGNALFDQVGKLAQVQNALNQNKLFQGQVAAGRALQQAIDPQTGLVDYPKANALITANPAAAPYALEAVNKLLTGQGQSIANTTGQTKLQGVYTDNLRQDFLAAEKSGDDPHLALKRGVAMGRYPKPMADTFVGGGDVGGLNRAVLARESAIALGPDAVRAAYGAPETQDTGGQQVTSLVNPATGTKEVMGGNGAVLAKTLTPSETVSPAYTRFNPTTQTPEIVTKGAAFAQGEGAPGAKPIQAGPPLGAEQAANTAARGSAELLNTDRADQAQSAQRVAILKHVDDLLASPEGTTGPGTQVINGWRNFVLAHAPQLAAITNGGVNEAKIRSATQDEIKKYMIQIAGNAAAPYGPGTNEKLAFAVSGNPNPDLSTLGNRDVTRMNIALERAKQARMAAWDASGEPVQDYGRFVSKWNRTHDPRAFMLDLLSPKERLRMLHTITKDADKLALLQGKKAAEAAGLFSEADIPR